MTPEQIHADLAKRGYAEEKSKIEYVFRRFTRRIEDELIDRTFDLRFCVSESDAKGFFVINMRGFTIHTHFVALKDAKAFTEFESMAINLLATLTDTYEEEL